MRCDGSELLFGLFTPGSEQGDSALLGRHLELQLERSWGQNSADVLEPCSLDGESTRLVFVADGTGHRTAPRVFRHRTDVR